MECWRITLLMRFEAFISLKGQKERNTWSKGYNYLWWDWRHWGRWYSAMQVTDSQISPQQSEARGIADQEPAMARLWAVQVQVEMGAKEGLTLFCKVTYSQSMKIPERGEWRGAHPGPWSRGLEFKFSVLSPGLAASPTLAPLTTHHTM